jgi:hypothetical protein
MAGRQRNFNVSKKQYCPQTYIREQKDEIKSLYAMVMMLLSKSEIVQLFKDS